MTPEQIWSNRSGQSLRADRSRARFRISSPAIMCWTPAIFTIVSPKLTKVYVSAISDRQERMGISLGVRLGPDSAQIRDSFRFADQPEVVGSNRTKRLILLKICRVKRGCSYLPTGTARRSSSEKFLRKIISSAAALQRVMTVI